MNYDKFKFPVLKDEFLFKGASPFRDGQEITIFEGKCKGYVAMIDLDSCFIDIEKGLICCCKKHMEEQL